MAVIILVSSCLCSMLAGGGIQYKQSTLCRVISDITLLQSAFDGRAVMTTKDDQACGACEHYRLLVCRSTSEKTGDLEKHL